MSYQIFATSENGTLMIILDKTELRYMDQSAKDRIWPRFNRFKAHTGLRITQIFTQYAKWAKKDVCVGFFTADNLLSRQPCPGASSSSSSDHYELI